MSREGWGNEELASFQRELSIYYPEILGTCGRTITHMKDIGPPGHLMKIILF